MSWLGGIFNKSSTATQQPVNMSAPVESITPTTTSSPTEGDANKVMPADDKDTNVKVDTIEDKKDASTTQTSSTTTGVDSGISLSTASPQPPHKSEKDTPSLVKAPPIPAAALTKPTTVTATVKSSDEAQSPKATAKDKPTKAAGAKKSTDSVSKGTSNKQDTPTKDSKDKDKESAVSPTNEKGDKKPSKTNPESVESPDNAKGEKSVKSNSRSTVSSSLQWKQKNTEGVTTPTVSPSPPNEASQEGVAVPVDDSKPKSRTDNKRAGPASHVPALLSKNRSRPEIENENKLLRAELTLLRKRLTKFQDEVQSLLTTTAEKVLLPQADVPELLQNVINRVKELRAEDDEATRKSAQKKGGEDGVPSEGQDISDISSGDENVAPKADARRRMRKGIGRGKRSGGNKRNNAQSVSADDRKSDLEKDSGGMSKRRRGRRRPRDRPNEDVNRTDRRVYVQKAAWAPVQPKSGDQYEHDEKGGGRQHGGRRNKGSPRNTQASMQQNTECDYIRDMLRNAQTRTELEKAILKAKAAKMNPEVVVAEKKLAKLARTQDGEAGS